jgi:poly-beta-1,6-N-acetyl-D-glucosamine synthase
MKQLKIYCSIGVCVYNEEKNIGNLLKSIIKQKLTNVVISEIIVIASGSIDHTQEIVMTFCRKDKRIKLIKQQFRQGKASAVNLFINKAKTNILVLCGGDLLLPVNVIERLVSKFADPEVGMAGCHPVPVNNIESTFCGFAGHLLWELHHRIALQKPKMGEMVAFRKIFKRIPENSSVDEPNIEPLIRCQGYKIQYVPEAEIYNKAPTKISDFIKQRRRIYNGLLFLKYEQGYEVATLSNMTILIALFSFIKENPKPKYILYTPGVILLEAYSRFLGWWDYKIAKKEHTIWEFVESTKSLV